MIERLTIRNYQSHKDTELRLAPGVNIIHGASDCGKSAVLRALLWAVTNRPSGESNRSEWGGDTAVCLSLSEGICVSRVRSKSENKYLITSSKGQGQELLRLGVDVPEEVTRALNMGEVNVQQQLDAPFLLSESAGEVARQLNAIANLEVIDTATVNVAREVRRYAEEERAQTSELARVVAEIQQFDGLPEQEASLVKTEQLIAQRDEDQWTRDLLSDIIQNVRHAEQALTAAGDIEGMEKQFEAVHSLYEAMRRKTVLLAEVDDLVNEIAATEREVVDVAARAAAGDELRALMGGMATVDRECLSLQSLKTTLEKVESVARQAVAAENDLKKHEKAFHDLMPERCPLCGRGK